MRLLSAAAHLWARIVRDSPQIGRAAKRALDRHGHHLFVCVEVDDKVEWVPVALLDLLRFGRAAMPADECRCDGAGCAECRGLGYIPERPSELALADKPLMDTPAETVEMYWWVQQHGVPMPDGGAEEVEPDERGSPQLSLLDLLEDMG